MENQLRKRLQTGFISLHILHHAQKDPVYGGWLLEELHEHGYNSSPGTLYPILHGMLKEGLLTVEPINVDGKIRKYYSITENGRNELNLALSFLDELVDEIKGGKRHDE
ncbi:MAG: PadR family transcriptional regulator [Firmicutes bacterium GWF2_51_9]|nr:helix-turn-helix transcriptional regulator [Erysipelotrichaceae bacterium]OGS55087.1 MAG: PadR family transcriptional regulator [Firmicutes bacterium GWF2_51_9]OGS57443.1 MAG: PadR family transcriptional regulator [Firmicutes bacterium GWE2_51_13]HAM63927.1 PadR family transcriptional regulator [Erysipelotrichaceae bacterium]HAO62121.1 PadR family transcriptional regulator [Erysipelotrichaceae bacterium]